MLLLNLISTSTVLQVKLSNTFLMNVDVSDKVGLACEAMHMYAHDSSGHQHAIEQSKARV